MTMSQSRLAALNHRYLSAMVWTLRILVGLTFLLSGFAKVIDEWGFVYKIEQYLAVWDIFVPRTLVLSGAVLLSGTEFVLGVLLVAGCYRRVVTWLLAATMAFMLPLTFYIMIENPVSDCGCFGDVLKISNSATFVKNVILAAAIAYLVKYNKNIKGIYLPYCQWFVAFVAGLYALVVALMGYNVQPLLDFRPFPVGSGLVADEDDSEDQDVLFVYEKDGKRGSFSPDELPDSSWTFVERAGAESISNDNLAITVFDGDDDVTTSVFHGDGEQLIVLVPDMRRADISYTYLLNELNRYMEMHGGEMLGLLATNRNGIEEWVDYSMARYPCYSTDDSSIKELARGNVALIYVKDGIIRWKRNMWSVPTDILSESDRPLEMLDYDGRERLIGITVVLCVCLMSLGAIQSLILALRDKLRHRRSGKSLNN